MEEIKVAYVWVDGNTKDGIQKQELKKEQARLGKDGLKKDGTTEKWKEGHMRG